MLTDEEIDAILERFDQTEPRLQRRIIAKFISDREFLVRTCREVGSMAGKDWLQGQLMLANAVLVVEGT